MCGNSNTKLFICNKCKKTFPISEKKRYGCTSCHSSYKKTASRKYRRLKAELEGRELKPRNTDESTSMSEIRKNIGGVVWYFGRCEELDKRQSYLAEWNAKEALRWWLRTGATDEYVKQWFAAKGEPWLNPRLSDAEKWRCRYSNDSEFAISERIRRQIKKKERRDGIADSIRASLNAKRGRSTKVQHVVGCTLAELKSHIESLFTDGMTWDEFRAGNIHIDHIIPQAAFDMNNDDDYLQCWHYSNLQPLWASDNRAKSDRLPCGSFSRNKRK